MQARKIQRKILKIIATFQEGSRNGSVNDAQIAEKLNLSAEDVRMHLDLMSAEGTVKLVKVANGGYIAILTPRGQITLKEPDYFQQQSFSRNESAAPDTNAVNDSGYHLSKIRTLLIEGFSETELRNFCFDTPEFRPVYHELAELTGKAKIVGHLLEFADRRELIDLLLIWAKENNPAKFARYQPYQVEDNVSRQISSVIPSTGEVETATSTPPDRLIITHPFPLELVCVPAGEFLMGSDPAKDKNAKEDEQPQHRVYVSEFFIGKYPITNEQYAVFVKATKHRAPNHWDKDKIPGGKENHPVVWVSWDDVVAFCQWLSQVSGLPFRLPTEAEWEKAARGTNGRIYPWGSELDKTRLNSYEGGVGGTTPVGCYSPGGDSPCGAADMAGNVWEWCADWFDEQEYQRWARITVRDPQGPSRGQYRMLRGGSWYSFQFDARCACRLWYGPDVRYSWGVRVVVSPI